MSQYEAKSAFDKESGIEQVKFGERRPVLETELNEMQEIQNHKRKEVIKSLYADGLVEGAELSYTEGIFNVRNALAILEGEIINIDSLSIEAEEGDEIYLDMWYEVITYQDEIKKNGNQQSEETIENKLLDSRIKLETTRRIQRQFNLTKETGVEGHFYLKLATIEADGFTAEKSVPFLNKIEELLAETEQSARQYTDQQIQYVTETGIPKLMCYSYLLKANEDNQTDFEIPLSTFDKNTDTVFVIQNTSFRNEDEHYSIVGNTIVLNTGVTKNTSIFVLILKNVPIGEDGSVTGKVITDGSLELKKLDTEVTKKEDFNEHLADYEYQTPTIVGTQIQIRQQSNTNRLYFKMNEELTGGNITVSLDGGTTDSPLLDIEGEPVTQLEKGFVEVIADANFFTLRNRGGGLPNGVRVSFIQDVNNLLSM